MKKVLVIAHAFIAMCISRPKEMGFSALMSIIALVAIYISTPPFVSKVFELKIYKNGKGISQLDDKREVVGEKTVWVDKLMLKDGYHIVHPKLGAIGFSDNFFIDIDGKFTVKEPGKYIMYPGSDDGFSLSIDGKMLCQFLGGRPYATRSCPISLDKGEHTFTLNYYQGAGHSGLTLAYRHKDAKKQLWFGENSKYITFH